MWRDLVALMPSGGVLPDLRFFEPTTAFLAALDHYQGQTVYDVGCGTGHVAEALRARGHRCLGIDVAERPSQQNVVIANGATFQYEPGSVVLLCRPCHGPFVQAVIEQAVQCGAGVVAYTGKPRNVAADLGSFRKRFRGSVTRCGRDGERLYLWEL